VYDSNTHTLYSLTSVGSSATSSFAVVSLQLGADDLNAIKADTTIGTERGNTFISVGASLITDMRGNAMDAITNGEGKKAADHQVDANKPGLTSFEALMPSGKPPMVLKVEFTETVNVNSVDPTKFTLYAGQDGDEANVPLTGATSKKFDGASSTTVLIEVTPTDLASLRDTAGLTRAKASTFLKIAADGVADNEGNKNLETEAPLKSAAVYTMDITAPELSQFDLDLNENEIKFRFTEDVVLSTFDPTKATLQFKADDASKKHVLSNGGQKKAGSSSVEIIVELAAADVEAIKSNLDLCKDKQSTFLSIAAGIVQDIAENDAVAIADGAAKNVQEYTKDDKGPTLESYTLAMETGVIKLTFNEIVNVGSFDASAAKFQSEQAKDGNTVESAALAGAVTSSGNAKVVEVTLTLASANGLRAETGLAVDAATTWLAISTNFITDVDDNGVKAIVSSSAKTVATDGFSKDGAAPALKSFKLDLSADPVTLTLIYEQPVDGSSFKDGHLHVQDKESQTAKIAIAGATAADAVSTDIVLTLTDANVNEIKAAALCTKTGDGGDCFVSHSASMIEDATGLVVGAVLDTGGKACTDYKADATAPTVIDLNMKSFDLITGKVTLSFSEIIDRSSFDKAKFEFQSDETDASSAEKRTLTGGTVDNDADATELTFTLADADLDYLKIQEELCTYKATS
jgi:hypothetical protein